MGLHLKIQPNERLIVNGCVIRNGNRATKIEVESRADILRGSEILTESECTTPVSRIQHAMQLAIVSAENRPALVEDILGRLSELQKVNISGADEAIKRAGDFVAEEDFYAAFKAMADVAERESLLLAVANDKSISGTSGVSS